MIIFFAYWKAFELGPTPWATPPAQIFCDRIFRDRVLRTISPGWLRTMILLVSASWVARIQAWATGTQQWFFWNQNWLWLIYLDVSSSLLLTAFEWTLSKASVYPHRLHDANFVGFYRLTKEKRLVPYIQKPRRENFSEENSVQKYWNPDDWREEQYESLKHGY
jgi:hypothetical protein